MISAYPLQWPDGWPRTVVQEPSNPRLRRNFTKNRDGIVHELEMMDARDVVISSNLMLRQDGLPYAGQRQPEDVGIAVYFTVDGEQQCIPCDKWITIEENLRAIEMTISALRGIERWGAKDMMKAAFRGFKALPAEAIVTPYTAKPWHEVLEVSPTASKETIKAAYKSMLLKTHPDQGGTTQAFTEVQRAYKHALEAVS